MIDGHARTAATTGAHDLASRGVAFRVNDAPAPVRRLQPQLEGAVAVTIEAGAHVDEIGNGRRGTFEDAMRGFGIAKAVAGRERVGDMEVGAVVGADAGGDAALGPGARGFRPERRGRQHDDRAGCHVQRRHQTGQTGPDDHRPIDQPIGGSGG